MSAKAERFYATYLIETPLPLDRAAAAMAGEQSTGTFLSIPGETQSIRDEYGARVEAVTAVEDAAAPSLPGSLRAGEAGAYHRGRVTLSWPLRNIGSSIPNLMATVAGNLTELRELSGIRLIDIDLPESFLAAYPGPRHGVAGTRQVTGVFERPLIGTIIKPSVGLTPAATARLVAQLVEAGIDFIKDDELIANPPYSTVRARVEAVMPVIHRHADETGKKVMYAFNITGGVDELLQGHDIVHEAGGDCIMVSLNWCGFTAVEHLRRHSELVIHGHRNGWGMFTRQPLLGMDFKVYQTLWRMIGVDHLHVNGIRNKFSEADESVIASARACLAPLGENVKHRGRAVMPIFSSSQTVDQVEETYRRVGAADLIYTCGGGIMGHPDGVGAGVAGLRQAWEAAMRGIPASTYAEDHPELKTALDFFGKK